MSHPLAADYTHAREAGDALRVLMLAHLRPLSADDLLRRDGALIALMALLDVLAERVDDEALRRNSGRLAAALRKILSPPPRCVLDA